ncbi:MAG: MotA/TolQ/ExbB proton channel family protein [Desulfovibrio sp.]|nr:MotA/TolQ/ExbB proton channel family protein [Desulfovibrio sp.]
MWEYFQAGGPLMWALLACSIVAVAVLLERFWFWSRLGLKKDESRAAELMGNAESGAVIAPAGGGPVTAMLAAGFAVPPAECGKAMEVVVLEEIVRMRRGMSLLDTIITAAPMLGIMGTVLGIISSFDMLGQAGVSDPKAVIAGIAQALITTATGLGIAVITIFPYNYFNSRIDQAQDIFEAYGTRLELLRPGAKE